MFADALLETSRVDRERRGWMTLASFGLQAVIIGLLLFIPLLTTVGLPLARTVSTPVTLGRRDPGPTPPVRAGGQRRGVQIIPYRGPIMEPTSIPKGVDSSKDTAAATVSSDAPDIGIGAYIGNGPGLPIPLSGRDPVIPPAPKPIAVPVFRTSKMLEGTLIRRVEPKYPPLAISARIQGPVVLAATISKAGTIQDLRLISGHPMLVHAALDAVSQWRYRPYILNGDVIEVETQITVNFILGER